MRAVTDERTSAGPDQQVNLLNTEVETRDATLRPGSPSNPCGSGFGRGNSWTPLAPVVEPPPTPASAAEPSCRRACSEAPCRTPRPRWQPAPARRHQNPKSRAQLTPRWNPPTGDESGGAASDAGGSDALAGAISGGGTCRLVLLVETASAHLPGSNQVTGVRFGIVGGSCGRWLPSISSCNRWNAACPQS